MHPQFEGLRRQSSGGGDRNGSLFQGAIPRRKRLSATHRPAHTGRLRGIVLFLQPLPIHNALHRIFHSLVGINPRNPFSCEIRSQT